LGANKELIRQFTVTDTSIVSFWMMPDADQHTIISSAISSRGCNAEDLDMFNNQHIVAYSEKERKPESANIGRSLKSENFISPLSKSVCEVLTKYKITLVDITGAYKKAYPEQKPLGNSLFNLEPNTPESSRVVDLICARHDTALKWVDKVRGKSFILGFSGVRPEYELDLKLKAGMITTESQEAKCLQKGIIRRS
jgi:hypothetical protein